MAYRAGLFYTFDVRFESFGFERLSPSSDRLDDAAFDA
jgi:hypothetical protein